MLWGLPSRSHPFHYKTDRRGFRNQVDREAGDIYLVGDSILVAAAVPFPETVCGRLEAATGLAAINIALIAISPQEERDLLLEAEVPLDGRLVLQFVFEGNDLMDSAAYRRGRSSSRPPSSFATRSLVHNLIVATQRATDRRVQRKGRLVASYEGQDVLFLWDKRSFSGLEGEWAAVAEALSETREYVHANGGTYGIVFVPAKLRVLGRFCKWPEDSRGYEAHLSPMRDLLLRWCKDTGTSVVDATPDLVAAASAGEIPWLFGDTHPSGVGHEAMLRAILKADFVRAWQRRFRR